MTEASAPLPSNLRRTNTISQHPLLQNEMPYTLNLACKRITLKLSDPKIYYLVSLC